MNFLKNSKRFSFLYNDRNIWEYQMKEKISEDTDSLTIEYLLPDGMKMTNKAKKYPDFDAYEWVTWFEYCGKNISGIISSMGDCDVDIPLPGGIDQIWDAYLPDSKTATKIDAPMGSHWRKGEFYCDIDEMKDNIFTNYIFNGQTKSYAASGGRSCNKQAPFFNVYCQDTGVIFAIGWTGQWNCNITRKENYINIKTCVEDTYFRLLPGEKIRTSSIVLMLYKSDVEEAQNKWRRLIKKYFSLIGQPGRSSSLPTAACTWGGMTTKNVLDRIKKIRDNNLPFDYIWMDAGWYGTSTKPSPDVYEGDWGDYTGDWSVNKTHHPDGLIDVSKAIADAGMKYLLWFEPERVRATAPIVSEHPEYFIFEPVKGGSDVMLDLGNPEALQYIYDTVSDIIQRLHISCYRQDFNLDPLRFWRSRDAAERKGLTEIKYIMGLYRFWDALLERFPELLIDNCASGGRRIDIELLRRSAPLWRTDSNCPANYLIEYTQTQNMNYSSWLPYHGAGTGWPRDIYRLRSAYAPGMMCEYSTSEKESFCETEEEIIWIRKYIKEYLTVKPYLCCDYYPLTSRFSDENAWCVSQYNRPESHDGVILAFRREKSPFPMGAFKMKGLDENKIYLFTDADDNSVFEVPGRELLSTGVELRLNNPRTAKIFFYRESV